MTNVMVARRRVAVVGAGVAGLTLAAALDPARFEVELYEAQPGRVTGAALGLWPDARRELTRLGVELTDVSPDSRARIHRLDGRPLVQTRTPAVAQVRRAELMASLRAAVPSSVRLVERGEGAISEPRELAGELVVGADGVRSMVRGVVCPGRAARRWTPWVTLRGIRAGASSAKSPEKTSDGVLWTGGTGSSGHSPQLVAEDIGLACEFWGSGKLFGDAPVGDGRYWFTAHHSHLGPEPLNVADVVAEAQACFAGAAPPVLEALADAAVTAGVGMSGNGSPPVDLLATRLWTTPALPRYRRGRYVVIGDAAHASLPNLARGATDAVLDATSLARVLNTGGSLAAWEARRLPVTQATRFGATLGMRVATAPWWA